jgi:endoglucanase
VPPPARSSQATAARSLKLLRPDDVVINLEASAAGPQAPQGRGPVIRVGDRTSVFDPAVTAVLTSQAQELTASDKRFRYQRALMAGGTCEATAFSALGLRAGSLCVPLGNYHNVDRRRGRLARETIDVDDWLGMLRLMLAVASSPPKVADWRPRLRRRLVERSAPLAKRLARTANGRRAPRSR